MSRSFKKNPVVKDGGNRHRYAKTQANRRVRRSKGISDGCSYKKLYCQYNICDNYDRTTLNEQLEFWGSHLDWKIGTKWFTTIQQEINKWKKWYIRK